MSFLYVVAAAAAAWQHAACGRRVVDASGLALALRQGDTDIVLADDVWVREPVLKDQQPVKQTDAFPQARPALDLEVGWLSV